MGGPPFSKDPTPGETPGHDRPENPDVAFNVQRLPEIFQEIERDTTTAIEVARELIIPLDTAGLLRVHRTEERLKRKATIIQVQQDTIAALVREFHIRTPLNRDFVERAVDYITDHPVPEEDQMPDWRAAFLAEAAMWIEELERINALRAQRESEGGVRIVSLSSDRNLFIQTSPKSDSIQLLFEPFVDPHRTDVKVGPDAARAILGAELTANDYERIYEALMNLHGPVGDAFREYAKTVTIWAAEVEAGGQARAALGERREAARKVMKLFDFGYMADVPLNAIMYSIVRDLPSFKDKRMPQPFES